MVAPASYGWTHALVEAVPSGGTVAIPAPDINDKVDENSVELAVDGEVIPDAGFDYVFDLAGKTVSIINASDGDWDAGATLYVSAQRLPLTGENLGGGDTAALEARIAALETQSAAFETRIAALETIVAEHSTQLDENDTEITDHESRIAALEAAGAPAARKR